MPRNILVIGTYCCGKTGRQLAKVLDAEYITQSTYNQKYYHLIIRYGNSYAGLPPRRGAVMNFATYILQTANKPYMRLKLLKHGIPAPDMYDLTKPADLNKFPMIARPASHYKGKNFHIVYNFEEAYPLYVKGYYFQEIVDKDTEFRLFIFANKIIEANIKEPTSEIASEMIRNHGHGWAFNYYPVSELNQELKDAARGAAGVSQLKFCAVDCCLDTNGKPYIFEINSAPSLIPRKLGNLAERIIEYYGLG